MFDSTYILTKIINATLVFAPIFHELNSLCTHKAYFSQILFTNLSKSVIESTSPLPR